VPKRKTIVVRDQILARDLLQPDALFRREYFQRFRIYRVRKNQKDLTPSEWTRFICAIEMLAEPGAAPPTYHDFVDIHDQAMTTAAGHMWGAHGGQNFLAWHREYLAKFEARLRLFNPLVTIPYWDWVNDRLIPAQLSDPADLAAWGVTRGASFNPASLPDQPWMNLVMASGVSPASHTSFQSALEGPHNTVHGVVGGVMGTSRSPADPLFWLHHCFIDKLWANWQQTNTGPAFNPPNTADTLQPPPIMTRTVAQVLRTTSLGYVYA
jgi:tyrosinase